MTEPEPKITTYRCPQDIADVFETDPMRGRDLAVKWAMGLDLKLGDQVWLPEIGWQTYEGDQSGRA